MSNSKKENISVAAQNESLNEKVSVYKNDLKNKEHDLFNIKKQIEYINDAIEEGKTESAVISQKIIRLIENLNNVQSNNQQVFIGLLFKIYIIMFSFLLSVYLI